MSDTKKKVKTTLSCVATYSVSLNDLTTLTAGNKYCMRHVGIGLWGIYHDGTPDSFQSALDSAIKLSRKHSGLSEMICKAAGNFENRYKVDLDIYLRVHAVLESFSVIKQWDEDTK